MRGLLREVACEAPDLCLVPGNLLFGSGVQGFRVSGLGLFVA